MNLPRTVTEIAPTPNPATIRPTGFPSVCLFVNNIEDDCTDIMCACIGTCLQHSPYTHHKTADRQSFATPELVTKTEG